MPVGKNIITVYEEYNSNAEKRKAQKGAKRGIPTGLARGYFFAFTCNQHLYNGDGLIEGVGTLFSNVNPGCSPIEAGQASSCASYQYLSIQCRRVGGKHLSPEWKKLWNKYRKVD